MLKEDRREIFHAMAEAQRMADYILGFHPDYAEAPGKSSDAEDEGATPTYPSARGLRLPEPRGPKRVRFGSFAAVMGPDGPR